MSGETERIFVFGSNLAGRHGAGAARHAHTHFGAKTGVGLGRTGKAYALPTKDHRLRSLPLQSIRLYVDQFIRHASENPHLEFMVTAVGTGLAGYRHADIAPMFAAAPSNCLFPPEWLSFLPSSARPLPPFLTT